MSGSQKQAEHGPNSARQRSKSLLLVEHEAGSRAQVQRILRMGGFAVTSVSGMKDALAAAAETSFAYAVTELRLFDGSGIELIRELRKLHAATRIVVVTGAGSFASVILSLRAGAADYLPKPVTEVELLNALLGHAPVLPPIPETPLRVERVCWEHIQRLFEQCGRNVTETARRLGMHRRSLQRMLGKNAPYQRVVQSS